ncbi:senescence-specific cysteine protease SAG12-like [Telopea speciosissima]|uniref:senescence-specific cysteine protease SAG12-like n=1 Tax=Telopea speciosissima TaxID=54955 RepID=UPI001CC554C1|nr:senescence-specific cysteine protease SAG12-like [Telopea speciosissima]
MSEMHNNWMDRYGRSYKDAIEKEQRFNIFVNNVNFISSFNTAHANRSYYLSINKFADLTNEEFRSYRNGFKRRNSSQPRLNEFQHGKMEIGEVPPSSVDWRKKGAVTPVKDQGDCGCCWAFSAVAALEGITKLQTGKLISLSEQELVDCDNTENSQGCEGGVMDDAFQFIQDNGGLATEANYPYQGIDGTCNTAAQNSNAAKISGYEDVPANNEAALLQAVAKQPVSVGIDASGQDFQFYSGGVFNGDCDTNLDHGVTAVGYGETDDGTKYWLVKNSWGTDWGEDGYIRMQRDIDALEGLCGITMEASYPIA